MHDLRTAPRWSKTAVVVVLVVFSLVLVVAIFGLWAFNSDQEVRAGRALDLAKQRAHEELDSVQRAVSAAFDGVIFRAVQSDEGLAEGAEGGSTVDRLGDRQGLRQLVEGAKHGPLVRALFRVDPQVAAGSVRWPGGRYQLLLGPSAVEARADDQMATVDRAHAMRAEVNEARKHEGSLRALEIYRELVGSYGLVAHVFDPPTEDPENRTPYGLSWAVEMLETTTNALTEGPVPPDVVHDVVMRALEAEVLYRDRAGLDEGLKRSGLGELRKQLQRVIAKLPEQRRGLLAWEVRRFRTYHDMAKAGMPPSGHLLTVAREAERRGVGRFVIHDSQLAPYGVGNVGSSVVVLLLDAQAVEDAVRGALDARTPLFDGLGVVAKVRRIGARQDPIYGVSTGSVQFHGAVKVPYQLDFWQTGEPRSIGDPRADNILFLAVIGLAIAGLIVGGYVLLRLLTREIRLAQLKADFVSNLSHELKTPITSISLFTEMLEEGKLSSPDDQAEAFGVLGLESRRLQRIVHRMIDVARGEARRNPYDLAPGDLNDPVREAAQRLRRIVKEPGLDLIVSLHERPLYVQMDGTAVDDAVTNLLSNAWKYKRGDRARIVVQTARRGRFAEITVRDDGIGIPRRERRKVFEMFYRAEQYLTHPVAGTGLGLALVRSVAAGHKGRVRVDIGEGGHGSTFRVRIPLDRKAGAALAREALIGTSQPEASGSGSSDEEPAAHGKVDASDRPNESPARSRATNPGAQS